MIPDGELLRRYTETNSESAFTELVERHLALVYSAALRQVNGDAHLAQDVAQTVFADLARKAATLADRPVLTGWLYTSAHFAAAKAVRTEQRRHTHEAEAHLMNQLLSDPAPDLDWEKLRPVLDAAMLELNESDREAVLLRYFDNHPHAEIAGRLGLSENPARMRVERALEKLHALLSRRGVNTTATLSAVISANAVHVAPTGLAATLSTAALTGTTLTTTAAATKAAAMTTLKKTLIAAALTAVVGAGIYQAYQASTLRTQSQMLQEQRASLAEQVGQLRRERDATGSELTAAQQEIERSRFNTVDLLRLRGKVARLRRELAALTTTATNMASVEVSASPARSPTRVSVKSRFIVGPGDVLAKIGLPKEGATGVLTDAQYRVLQKTLEKSEGVQIFDAPEVWGFSGQVISVNPATVDGPVPETVSTLGFVPAVEADDITINLSVSGRFWETKLPSKEAGISNNPVWTGADQLGNVVVLDGQTVAVSKKLTSPTNPASPASANAQLLVVFVSPILIDAAGNRLHLENELEELTDSNRK